MRICNRIVSIVTAGFMFAAAAPAFAAQVDAVWNVGSGNWNAAANWLPAVVPNNGTGGNTYHVKIDNGAGANAVTALNQIATIDLLTVTAGDTLNFNNIQDLRIEIGPIVNDGLISINGSNSPTDLMIASSMSLNGTGILQLSNSGNSRIYGVTGGPVQHLTHAATHTIRGGGSVGVNLITMTNNGLIEASTASTMSLDLEVGANVNAGTIQAVGTGILNINNTEFNNTAGFIKALGTSTVNFNTAIINGGELQADAGAALSGNASTFRNITLTGLFRVDNIEDIHCEGTITNNGTFFLNGGNSATEFRILDGGATLAGSGVLEGNNDPDIQNYINDNAAATPPLLVNTATHTIRGGIRVGNNRVLLNNQGLIDASVAGATMTLDLAAGANVNTGTIQASGTGGLIIDDTVLDNTAGLIKALGTSGVSIIDGSSIDGGQLQADPGALFTSRFSSFKNITLTGLLRQLNIDDVTYEGTITNNGKIELLGANSPTVVIVHANGVTFTGSGLIEGNNDPDVQNYISDNAAATPPLLINSTTHTIRGGIRVGNNRILLNNQGLVDASVAGAPMTLDLAAGANVNTGTIQASAAGTLNIVDSVLVNTGGLIKALGTSAVNITSSTIDSGQLQADAGAAFSGDNSTLKNITLTGLLRHDNSEEIIYEGTITNNGRIELNSSNAATVIRVVATGVTFAGTGEIVFGNDPDNLNFIADTGLGLFPTFVNGATHTLRGSGNLGANVLHITNNGTILANQSLPMVIDPPADGQGFLNTGTVNVVTQLNILNGAFNNTGTINIGPDALLSNLGQFNQTAGSTTVNGNLNAGTVDIQGGMMTVNGTLNAVIFAIGQGGTLTGSGTVVKGLSSAGTVAPGDGIGELRIAGGPSFHGGLVCGPSSIISIEIGGLTPITQHDVLNIGMEAVTQIDGVLKVRFVNGFDPQVGDNFTVMHYHDPFTLPGTQQYSDFDSFDVPCNLPGRRVEIYHVHATDFFAGSVIVRIIAAADLGGIDVNCDCVYNMDTDVPALILALLDPAGYAAQYPGCTGADVNGDTLVNGQDVQAFVTALLN